MIDTNEIISLQQVPPPLSRPIYDQAHAGSPFLRPGTCPTPLFYDQAHDIYDQAHAPPMCFPVTPARLHRKPSEPGPHLACPAAERPQSSSPSPAKRVR